MFRGLKLEMSNLCENKSSPRPAYAFKKIILDASEKENFVSVGPPFICKKYI